MSRVSAAVAALTMLSGPIAWGQARVDFGRADGISLDQFRVPVNVLEAGTTDLAVNAGFVFALDTGANGTVIGAGGHVEDFLTGVDPTLYNVIGTYLETGVAGTVPVNLAGPYGLAYTGHDGDPFFSGVGPTRIIDQQFVFTDPGLDLGSFDGIIGMPAMDGRVVHASLSTMTGDPSGFTFGIGYIGIEISDPPGSAPAAPAPPPGSTQYRVEFSQLPTEFNDPVGPDNDLPTFAPLPLIEQVAVTARPLANSAAAPATQVTGQVALMDSGAQLSLISEEMALGLGLDLDELSPTTDVRDFLQVSGVGGSTFIPLVVIDEMRLPASVVGGDPNVEMVFRDMPVGVLTIDPDLDPVTPPPFDIVLGFNPWTTGYLENLLISADDGLFTDMRLDFTDPTDWHMVVTQNAAYDIPIVGDLTGDGVLDGADIDELIANFGGDAEALIGYDLNFDGVIDGLDLEMLLYVEIGTSPGDANLDLAVNIVDLGILATHFGELGTYGQGDFNGDGTVNIVDLGILATNFGGGSGAPTDEIALQAATIPEPAALVGLAIGAALALPRRGTPGRVAA